MKRAVRANFDASAADYTAYEAETGRFAALARRLRDAMAERGAGFDPVLDAGAGTGASTAVLAEAGEAVALDASRGMLAANDAAPRVQGDLERLPFAGDCFAAVAFTASLFVVPAPELAAAEARRVLREDGVVGAMAPEGWYAGGTDVFAGRERASRAPEAVPDIRAGLEAEFTVAEGVWSFETPADHLRAFFAVPAMGASLYPKLPVDERRQRVLALLDDLEGPVEHRWRWFIGR